MNICYKYVNILILIQCKQNIERKERTKYHKKHCAKLTGWWLFILAAGDLQKCQEIKLVWQLTVCGKSFKKNLPTISATLIILGIFCQPNGKMPALAKATHLSKAFPTCFHLTCGENSMVMRSTKVPCWHVWRRKFVESESDTCDQKPWKPCNFTNCVTQLQSHLCQHQSDFLFCFWGNCVNLHLCVCNITCTICAHTKKSRLSCSCPKFVTQKKSIVSAWL